jgi:hypothetical protein
MPTLATYSEVALCNLALAAIGHGMEISSLDEASNAARACKLHYPYARDATLRAYDWNFAARRASLPAAADTPPYGYASAYLLPADCILVRKVHNTKIWEIERRHILTSVAPPLQITYTSLIQNPGEFDALFTDALTTRLASDLAVRLSDNLTRAQQLYGLYLAKLAEARRVDSSEGMAPHQVRNGWLGSRFDRGYVECADFEG